MDRKEVIAKMIKMREEEIIIFELTEKFLQRKVITEGKKYETSLGQVQLKLKEAKDFLTFLQWELE